MYTEKYICTYIIQDSNDSNALMTMIEITFILHEAIGVSVLIIKALGSLFSQLKKGSPKPFLGFPATASFLLHPMKEITGTPARPRGTCRRSECSACPHGPRGC